MTTSSLIAHRIAGVLVGFALAGLSAEIIGSVWSEMRLPVFLIFLLAWGLSGSNTIALERRHPELILSPGWKRIKVCYKPRRRDDDEYEITRSEFIRGQIAMILFGLPVALLIAGLVGIISPAGRWFVFCIFLGGWAVFMLVGIISAIQRR